MKRVKKIEYDSGLIFTEEEFDKIKLVKKKSYTLGIFK